MNIKKILIAVDASDFSLKAAKKAIEFSKTFKSEVSVVFVLETIKPVTTAELGYMAVDVVEKARAEAGDILAKLSDETNTKFDQVIPEGNPWEVIIETAKSIGADMITLSTHGRTGLMHLLLGSVAESVVQHSPVPVLIYPAKCL